MLISPLLTKGIQKILRRQQSRYSQEVLHTLSFIPVLKTLTVLAWRKSNVQAPPKRFYVFFTSLVHSTLIYTDPDTENKTA
jgi:hypothetical protein